MTPNEPTCSKRGRYTTQQVCDVLEVSRSTVYRAIKDGDLSPIRNKISGRRYFTGLEIVRYWRKITAQNEFTETRKYGRLY